MSKEAWIKGISGIVVFAALAAASALLFLRVFAPDPLPRPPAAFDAYDRGPMDAALAPDKVRAELDAIAGFGSRFPGQDGYARTQDRIGRAFRDAGLDVMTLPARIAAPRTERREILGPDGKPLAGVGIYPFWPNHMQPMVTPPPGITGELLLVTDNVLAARRSLEGCIAVVETTNAPLTCGVNWSKYAELRCKAVIIAHRDGFKAVKWSDVYGGMLANTPVNFVRLAATEGIFNHLGETVTIHARTAWREEQVPTLIGILRGASTNREAVLVTSSSEACSILPDLAPGVLTAMEPAVLLSSLRGMLPYRGMLRRDIVFVSYASRVMGNLAADSLAGIAGPAIARSEGLVAYEKRLEDNRREAAAARAAAACFADPEFLSSPGTTARAVAGLTDEQRTVLAGEVRYVLNSMVFELSEIMRLKLVAFESEGGKDTTSPLFAEYREAKRAHGMALDTAGLPLDKLCRKKSGFLKENNVRERCAARFAELESHFAARIAELESALAVHRALASYDRLSMFSPCMMPADTNTLKGETFSFYMGGGYESLRYYQSPALDRVIRSVARGMNLPDGIAYQDLRTENHHGWAAQQVSGIPTDTGVWNAKGHPAFSMVNTDRKESYQAIGWPVELPYMRDTESMRYTLVAYGRTLLSLGLGNGRYEPPLKKNLSMDHGGGLFVFGVGKEIVPNYPLKHGLVGHKGSGYKLPGYYAAPFFFADARGRYDLPLCSVSLTGTESFYSPEAAGFDTNGLVYLIKDEGKASQRVYKSTMLGNDRKNVNIVLFRAVPVTLLDMINPQTLKAFASAGFVTREGLAAADSFNNFKTDYDGFWTSFLPPETRIFATLKAGSAENDLVQATRAFILNTDAGYAAQSEREIDGRGYLPMTNSLILDMPAAIAESMLQVNSNRLALQNRHGIADDRTRAFHTNSIGLLGKSRQPGLSSRDATLIARDAAAYAILNHPVIRNSISEAILSILWYLALLVPFVFFFEKLVFGFPDIRSQLAAQAAIFVVAFVLLRLLHPAFQMINSSLMILLGFIIMLISGGMTLLFSFKFQENLEGLKKKRGQVAMAEANTMGMLGTAFALGLNNMRRRYVRTWLTCATLVLITFTMICFTSVQSDIVETERAIGKAVYNGMLVKPRKFEPITPDEQSALDYRYGHRFEVAPRAMMLGQQEWNRVNYNPVIEVVYRPESGRGAAMPAGSMLSFDVKEPLRDRIKLLTSRGWFVKKFPGDKDSSGSVMLPGEMAQKLGIQPSQVDATNVYVTVNGARVRVHGIFDSRSLASLRDLDGNDLLPFDLTAVRTIQGKSTYTPLVDEDAPRMSADSVILINGITIPAEHGAMRATSVAVAMPSLKYEEAREEVTRYLEQNGRPAFYGLGDTAYWGHRVRKRTVAGIVELLVPLLIAALTVLNTMRGSVYERKDEIFVYNAVGIAPKYIFSMFFTEAFVYAVIGSVLGYILSQGTGRILTALDLTGGLNMTFATSSTIHASLAIAATVFLSTIFPARQALQIAAPAEDSGWKMPEPQDDRLSFNLPFTFGARDRIAVLAFFNRFLLDHGEGGAGRFFASEPSMGVETGGSEPVPGLSTGIWLKPFDLGVSQKLTISLPTDPETREFIAQITMERVSGTRESWMRLNQGFVAILRQRFLHWRAVSAGDRRELFDEARREITGRA